jgi:hypothetical protein
MFQVLDSDHLHHRCNGVRGALGAYILLSPPFSIFSHLNSLSMSLAPGVHIYRLQDGRSVHNGGWHMPLWSYLEGSGC